MIISDPYSTSYGKLINKERVTKELTKYLISTSDSRNYEFKNSTDCRLLFITGCNPDEKDLQIFNQPLVFKNMKNEYYVAVDLRKYVRQNDKEFIYLQDEFKDKAGCKFLTVAACFISDFVSEEFGAYRPVYKGVTAAYAMFISYLVDNVIKLNPAEKIALEINVMWFANLLLIPSAKKSEYHDSIIAKISNTKLSIPTNRKMVANVLEGKESMDLELSVEGLITLIKASLPDEKKELITEGVLLNMLANVWCGPGGNETIIMALECMPLWIALVYTCCEDLTYKRTKLSTIFEKYSKSIENKDLVKTLDLVMKEKRMTHED